MNDIGLGLLCDYIRYLQIQDRGMVPAPPLSRRTWAWEAPLAHLGTIFMSLGGKNTMAAFFQVNSMKEKNQS